MWYSRNFKRREPVGTCYTARNNFEEFFEYSPCRTSKCVQVVHPINPTKNDLMNLSLLLDDGKVTINEISTQPRTFLMHKSVCYFWFLKWLCRIIHLSSTFYIHPYFMTQWAKLIDLFYPLCTSNPSFTLLECAAQLYILLQGTQITKKPLRDTTLIWRDDMFWYGKKNSIKRHVFFLCSVFILMDHSDWSHDISSPQKNIANH